jgi:protein gp37
VPSALVEPLKWRKPRRVFVNSMSDLFHEKVTDEQIAEVFAVMAACPQHTFQVLTKRAERMLEWTQWAGQYVERWPLPNVWGGVSVEDQGTADKRIRVLLRADWAVRFVSAEPLIGPVHLGPTLGLHWVIVGGESGPGARPFDLQWARSLVRQCSDAGVACFVKQIGSRPFDSSRFDIWDVHGFVGYGHGLSYEEAQKTAAMYVGGSVGHGRVLIDDRKGGDPRRWPEEIRVREFPTPPEPSR